MRVCSVPGCATIYQRAEGSRCQAHRRAADKARGTATERGYTSKGHRRFRAAVLARDPICVLCDIRESTVADHWPLSRRELLEQGMNPNASEHGRGLCTNCHNKETAVNQPGGWNTQN